MYSINIAFVNVIGIKVYSMSYIKKTILLDLDGVINEYTKGFHKDYIPPVKKGAENFLINLSHKFKIKLFTTREKSMVKTWLSDNGLDKYFSGITNIKEACWLIVDDRCIKFNGDYDELLSDIMDFHVWHEKIKH